MRVHHLNCATMCPFSARLINGEGGVLAPGRLVAHCLLIESDAGLVLVDTGIGLDDLAAPRTRLGAPFLAMVRPTLSADETAARQVERLGFRREDVRHIVVTHLDLDHAGGLPDFPAAEVHVLEDEHRAAMRRATLGERMRYVSAQWAHQPRWTVHPRTGGDRWMGFESVRALGGGVEPEVLLVPLTGHTRGHCGVAVRRGDGWLLHCGDAYFFRDETDPVRPRCTPGLELFQRLVAVDGRQRRANQRRLVELRRDHGGEVRLFCAHDATEFEQLRAGA